MVQYDKKNAELSKIIKDSFLLIKKTILLSILITILMSCVVAILSMLILPDFLWEINGYKPQIEEFGQWLELHEGEPLPDESAQIQRNYTVLYMTNLIINSSFIFVPLLGMLLFLPSRIYYLYTNDDDGAKSLKESIKMPFKTKNQGFTGLFMLFFYPFILSFGILMLYLPGILFMIYCFFGFQSLILDEKSGREVFRGGIFYAKGNGKKIIIILFLSIFIPLIITNFYSEPIMDSLGLTGEALIEWSNPSSRNYGAIFIFYFVNALLQNLGFFWFPTIHTVAFTQFRLKKLHEMKLEKENEITSEEKVKKIIIRDSDKYYNCRVCGRKIPISAKKCNRCGQLYKLYKKKKSNDKTNIS